MPKPKHRRATASSKPRPKLGRPTGERLVRTLRRHANDVIRVLGKGHSERVYHRAMITSLNNEKIPHRSEVIAPIYYMGDVVGFGRCDIIIGNLVVEFKANMACPRKTSNQLQKYLESMKSATRKTPFHGVVINFSQKTGKIEMFQERRRHIMKKPSC